MVTMKPVIWDPNVSKSVQSDEQDPPYKRGVALTASTRYLNPFFLDNLWLHGRGTLKAGRA